MKRAQVNWPEISNPLAREVVQTAWQLKGLTDPGSLIESSSFEVAEQLSRYRDWLRSSLAASGLAQRLAAGLEAFPDITAELRWPARQLAQLARPRNYRDLTRHLLKHLDWYLDPRQPLRSELEQSTSAMTVVMLAGLALFRSGLLLDNWAGVWLTGFGAIIFAGSALIARSLSPRKSREIIFWQAARRIRSAEFYFYLWESYGGGEVIPEPELYAAGLSAEALQELDQPARRQQSHN